MKGPDCADGETAAVCIADSRALLDALPAAAYACDADGRITYFNSLAASLWGRRPRLGDKDDRFCGSLRLYWPDGREMPHADSPMARAVRDGIGCRNQEVTIERPDGSRVHVLVNIDPLRADDGRRLGAVNAFIDITEQRQQERSLRRLADALPQLVWTARPDGVVDYYNRRVNEFAGIQRAADGSWTWEPVLHPDDREPTIAAWRDAVNTGGTYECEHRVCMADGGLRWHLSRAVPVRDDQGHVWRWFGTATDIHDVKLAQEALRAADERKSRFVATLAHELRNPLAPIRTAVELLRLPGQPPAAIASARDIIDRQSGHLARLVDDLLDISRISRGRLKLQRAPVQLAHVVEHALETVRPAIERRRQHLELRLPSGPVVLHADGARLAQVLVNLLDNASKYSSEGQRIGLGGDIREGRLRLWVSDDGVGIHASDLPHLFETFAPVGETSGDGRAGLGIGLALTRRLLEMHGGSIEASSAGPGCGTTLTLWLPLPADDAGTADAVPSPAAAAADPPPAPRTTRGDGADAADARAPQVRPRILVVDDNADVAQSLSMLLEVHGFQVFTAADGMAAVDAAGRERPDVVLLDIGMPGIDGYEVCRRIRRQPGGASMRIIALTGWGQMEDRRRSAAAGFDGHLVKPIEPAALLGMLR